MSSSTLAQLNQELKEMHDSIQTKMFRGVMVAFAIIGLVILTIGLSERHSSKPTHTVTVSDVTVVPFAAVEVGTVSTIGDDLYLTVYENGSISHIKLSGFQYSK